MQIYNFIIYTNLVESAAPVSCNITDMHDRLWVISIYVEDGGIDDAGHI